MNYIGQTRIQSLIESWTNVLVGWIVGLTSQVLLFPLFGIHSSFKTNLWLSLWFTLISIARSYALRRYYNWSHGRVNHRRIENELSRNSSTQLQ